MLCTLHHPSGPFFGSWNDTGCSREGEEILCPCDLFLSGHSKRSTGGNWMLPGLTAESQQILGNSRVGDVCYPANHGAPKDRISLPELLAYPSMHWTQFSMGLWLLLTKLGIPPQNAMRISSHKITWEAVIWPHITHKYLFALCFRIKSTSEQYELKTRNGKRKRWVSILNARIYLSVSLWTIFLLVIMGAWTPSSIWRHLLYIS